MQDEKAKKILRVVSLVLTWVIVAVAVFMMIFTIVSVSVFDRNDRDIFGYHAFIVKSDSMSATDFKAGDLIFSKEVDPATLVEGDIITFQSVDPNSYGEIITHKIRKVTKDTAGNVYFTTYGTTTNTDDETPVTASFVLGKYTGKLAGMGTFFNFLKSTPGYIVCILIPFLLLIAIQGFNTVKLFKKYKGEQLADIEEERRKVAEEREESQRLLAELRAMKEEMERGKKPEGDTPAEETAESAETAETADDSSAD